jgi:hypothetical protein
LYEKGLTLQCVLTGSLSLAATILYGKELLESKHKHDLIQSRRALRKEEAIAEIEIQKQEILGRISHLSNRELSYLADCLREKSQSFTTYVNCSYVAMLQSKGLVYSPGGIHHQDYYPFVIEDFVWKYLLDHQEQIVAKDDESKKQEEKKKTSSW